MNLNRMLLIMKWNPIDSIKIIAVVKVYINTVHHHDHFTIHGWTPILWIHNERAVESFGDMARKWEDMAMIEVQTKRFRIKLIREAASRFDESTWTGTGNTIHLARVKTMKVHRMRMIAAVTELDPNSITFRGSQGWTRDSSVIRPGGKFNARDNFNILVECDDFVFPQCLPVWQGRHFPVIKICQDIGRVKTILLMVYFPHRTGQVTMLSLLHIRHGLCIVRLFVRMTRFVLGQCRCASCTQHGESTHLQKVSTR